MAAWFWQYLYIFIVYYAFMVPQILSRAFVLRRLLINQRYKELLSFNSPPSCDVKQSRLNTFFKFAPSFPRRFHWWKNIMSRVYALNYSSKVHCFWFGKKIQILIISHHKLPDCCFVAFIILQLFPKSIVSPWKKLYFFERRLRQKYSYESELMNTLYIRLRFNWQKQ